MLKEMLLDVNQHISFDFIHVNLTSNLFIWVMIFEQIYRKMKKEASIKNSLMKKILHTDFLRENLLKQDFEIENEHYLYETKIPSIMKLILDVNKTECIMFTKDDRNTMKVLIEDYQLDSTLENRILTSKMYFSNLALLSDKLKQNYLQTSNLIYEDSRNDRFETELPRKIKIKFDTIDLFYNCDLLLSAFEDINDLVLISKYFKRQNHKYKIFRKQQWIESVELTGNKFIIDWFLGGRRYLKFLMTDVKTVDMKKAWSKLKEGSMQYFCSTFSVVHTKFKRVERNPYEIDLSVNPDEQEPEYKKLEDTIIKARDLSYMMIKGRKNMDLIFNSGELDAYLPNHLHFGALIKAMMKQIKFQIRWHKISYKEYKDLNRIKLPPRAAQEQTLPRDFRLVIKTSELSVRGEDQAMAKCLIYQNEIVSALNEKELTHCNPEILFLFRRQLIKNKLQEDYTSISATNFRFELTKPRKYHDKAYCLSMIKELDEAKHQVNPELFDYINAIDFSVD